MRKGLTKMNHTYPESYVQYLIYFHGERDYFECHEVLEEYWKEHPDSELSEAWVGLIQVAVGLYHERRGNLVGALKMLGSAVNKLSYNDLEKLGIDAEAFITMIKNRLQDIEKNNNKQGSRSFKDLNIPLSDGMLVKACVEKCEAQGLGWCQPSDLSNEQLIHKHKLRDRSDVVEARLKELALRQHKRGNNRRGEK